MAKIARFEDILAWQKARNLVRMIYATSGSSGFSKDYSFRDQIRRAALSVMSNIAEGFLRNTDKEHMQFLRIALGSAAEVQSLLYSAMDLSYIREEEFKDLYAQAKETSRLITGFIQYLDASEHKSTRPRRTSRS